MWVDGVHFNIRPEEDRLCTLVMIGALPNGEKELLAVEDSYRESAESWKTVLRELKRRGMVAPVLAVGDGALGSGPRRVRSGLSPANRPWCHKLVNVLDKLLRRLQPRAKRALHEMTYAESRSECEAARTRFAFEYQAKYPKAVESLTANWARLTAFFDFPGRALETSAHHERGRIGVRHQCGLRERATLGAGSRTKGLLMAFKLLNMAQQRWRRLDGAHLLPLVRAGIKFVDGV